MADQFCLRWNNFQSNMVSALESLKLAEDLVDVTLTCEGRNIRAHKVILSACSPYFRTVFKENPCQHPVIILKDVLAEDVVGLLSYMYQGEVFIEESKLTSFLHTAALLQVKGLTGVPPQHRENITTAMPITTNKLYTQLTISSKNSPFNSQKEPKPSPVPKKRRSSTSDKPNIVSCLEGHSKRTRGAADQVEVAAVAPAVVAAATAAAATGDVSNADRNHTDGSKSDHLVNANGNASHVQLPHASKDASLVTIKTEMEENESPENDSGGEKENEGLPDYENSMLARSLLSGINPSKSDINANNSSPKSKMPLKLDAVRACKKSPPKSLPLAEEQIKSERRSPPGEAGPPGEAELEPEVLLSEGDGATAALPGASGAPPHQANHAAICGDCPHCGMKYSNQSALKYHVRLMHSDLTNRLCCYLCPRSFTMRETFKEHMWSTHGQRN